MTPDSAIAFFLYDTGDKIIKSDEALEHLRCLEAQADNGGFSTSEFADLLSVLTSKPFPAQLGRRFVNCLVPNQPVNGK